MTTKAATSACSRTPVPPVRELTHAQYAGHACYACGQPLTHGAIPGGQALGRVGERVLDTEVWACP